MDLENEKIDNLVARLDELVRWRPGGDGSYQDPNSALSRIQGKTNHVVMGRRGSGKTRLLSELSREAEEKDVLVIKFGVEEAKELAYPDILIQILRSFVESFHSRLTEKPDLLTKDWFLGYSQKVTHPVNEYIKGKKRKELLPKVEKLRDRLNALLEESDEIDAEYQRSESGEKSEELGIGGGVEKSGKDARFNRTTREMSSESRTSLARQKENKKEKVERLLLDFKDLMEGVAEHFGSCIFFVVDDFYFIRRIDQPPVIDYIHRICKDSSSFLKIATIRHRSQLYEEKDLRRGVVAGHEAQVVDLELPLGRLDSINRFLKALWRGVCEEVGIEDPESIFKGQGFEQAVLASGGVPRDFFGVVKTSISISRERNEDSVGKMRVNEAAQQYAEDTKMPELQVDTEEGSGVERELRDLMLFDIVRFCRDIKKKNCFHINKDALDAEPGIKRLVDLLVDARLIHLITDNTSNSKRAGRYSAYFLDVGLYAHPQRRGENSIDEVAFWVRDDAGRLKNLERSPVYQPRKYGQLEELARRVRDKEVDLKDAILSGSIDMSDTDGKTQDMIDQLKLEMPVTTDE